MQFSYRSLLKLLPYCCPWLVFAFANC